jgi:hypothetical protein
VHHTSVFDTAIAAANAAAAADTLDPVGAATAAAVAAYAAQAASMSFLPKTKPYQAKRAAALALAAETERKSATAKLQRAATDSSSLASFTKAAPTPPPPVRPPAASKKAAPASPKETGTAAASAKAAAVKHAVQMNEEELRQVTFASARCVCVCGALVAQALLTLCCRTPCGG